MTRKIFVDTDVVFDLLAKREPFYTYAAQLFTNADKQEVTICVSSRCFGNLNYILSKHKSAIEARKILSRFKVLVTILPVDDKVIELALNSDFIENGINILVTRNLKDFKHARIPILTAEEFVKQIE